MRSRSRSYLPWAMGLSKFCSNNLSFSIAGTEEALRWAMEAQEEFKAKICRIRKFWGHGSDGVPHRKCK